MSIYIALLRGINVGGKNKIKMAELRESLGTIGLQRVQTYIQSGNILFESNEEEQPLRERIEQTIEADFGLAIKVVMRTLDELRSIKGNLPFSEQQVAEAKASAEGEVLYVSMLLERPLPDKLEKLGSIDTGEDRYVLDGINLYLLYSLSVRNSKLSAHVEKLGVPSTVRNWNTINKLIELGSEMEAAALS
ncbi:DUF1697 domain-containing protein [Paenibacillus paeoniae]|uniref:DUF1697 domain-containing protein n=1 Tax=Paenibacillus paeoniae TaxID=2292705 RepID=A0A371PN29_9BACL|nr:DUF1697 domain-containing protein [Paenibacillus paeoniae]REK77578.1 DUF1697 domain-containing protein [Paenibacillus paeoniae]